MMAHGVLLSAHVVWQAERLDELYATIEAELERYVDDVFRIFGAGGRMKFKQFEAFTAKAPITVRRPRPGRF